MLTLFTCPKPFKDKSKIIQTNAIHSWTLLDPKPEIIIIGNEEGAEEICQNYGLRHIPQVKRNEYGTPLISSVFEIAQKAATYPLLCYLNSDIILLSDFIRAIQFVAKEKKPPFLLAGRRWDIGVNDHLDFNHGWEDELKNAVKERGEFCAPNAIDYFIFPKGLYSDFLPFIIGRIGWDNWLISHTLSRKIPVIDLTALNLVVHQRHNYAHLAKSGLTLENSSESLYNKRIMGCWPCFSCSIWDSTHVLTENGIKKAPIFRRIDSSIGRFLGYMEYWLKAWYPFTYPIHMIGRFLKFISVKIIRNTLHKIIGRYRFFRHKKP